MVTVIVVDLRTGCGQSSLIALDVSLFEVNQQIPSHVETKYVINQQCIDWLIT